MSKKPLVVIGSSNTDMVIQSERIPKAGETIIGGTFFMNPGGKGANQAVAAARLGGDVTFVANVGDDIFGKQAIDLYAKDGIHTVHIHLDNSSPTGVALITVDAKGENSIVVASGANGRLTIDHIQSATAAIKSSQYILLQLEIPLPVVDFACSLAKEHGVKIILNPAPAQPLGDSLLKNISIITPNESEAELLTGIAVTDVATARRAAHSLLDRGVTTCIITMGKSGAFVCQRDTEFNVSAPSVTAVDTTAAGDVFNGALAVALSEGMTLKPAVDFACRAAAISVTRLGAQASAPFRNELTS